MENEQTKQTDTPVDISIGIYDRDFPRFVYSSIRYMKVHPYLMVSY